MESDTGFIARELGDCFFFRFVSEEGKCESGDIFPELTRIRITFARKLSALLSNFDFEKLRNGVDDHNVRRCCCEHNSCDAGIPRIMTERSAIMTIFPENLDFRKNRIRPLLTRGAARPL